MAVNPFVLTYGVELTSSWANAMLYMLELVMCMRYFQRPSRPLAHKIGVGAMVLFDTICTATVCGNVFLTSMAFFKQASFLSLSIPTSLTIFTTYCTAAVVQLFLCHLYFVLTRNRVVSILLAFLVVSHLGVSFAAGIMLQTAPSTFNLTYTVTAAGAISCAVTDILIAGCLGLKFFRMQTGHSSTPSLMRRIFVLSITSGAIVASVTLLMMILFLTGNIAFIFFFSCQGRVYALTLLVNFLSGAPTAENEKPQPESSLFRVDAYPNGRAVGNVKQPSPGPPSIHSEWIGSNISEEPSSNDLPPLLPPPGPQLPWRRFKFVPPQYGSFPPSADPLSSNTTSATPRFALVQSQSPSVPFPTTPQTARTFVFVPKRVDSLPQNV